jgi:hypothetical protein
MDVAVRRIGGRATQEQLPSVIAVAIYNSLISNQKIAALRNDELIRVYLET